MVERESDSQWLRAPAHPKEDARVEELLALDLVNLADAQLDSFTRLAALVLKAPVAHIGLPSHDKNWIKAGVGIDIDSCDRSVSFCGHAIHEHDMLLVPDTGEDARFANHPLVTGPPHVHFYAGAVIKGRHGEPLGTLCIIDHEPRTFSAEEQDTLRHIRDIVQERILDYAERRTRHEEILREATIDAVTGLPNARELRERLEQAVQWVAADDEDGFGVFMVDILRFRDIKRGRGRRVAAGVLAAVGQKLTETLPAGYVAGRWRDDVFLVITPHVHSVADLTEVAGRVLADFEAPLDVEGVSVPISVRLGASRFPDDGNKVDELIDAAEQAVERLFEQGRSGFATADREINAAIAERLDLERRLRRAIDAGELTVVYQPKICVSRGEIIDAEALVRWHEPDLGWVSPGRFIPVAEEAGLIGALGANVLEQACREAGEWTDSVLRASTVAVNVSTIQLQDDGFPETVRDVLERTNLPGGRLILEVTESALMKDADTVVANMQEIAELGVRFAIDDFGTGYASFDYLRRLPIHSLKIDRQFVAGIVERDSDARICQAMIALGHALNLTVVAEGVETREQSLFLKAYACDQVQGFYFSKPLATGEFQQFVRAHNASLAVASAGQ